MTKEKDKLWKIIESQSWDDKAESILKAAVDEYLLSINETKPDVSGVLPLELIEWWEGLRPEGWDVIQHLSNPYVNCQSEREQKLAIWISCRLLVSNSGKPIVMSRFSRDKLIHLINDVVESKQTLGAEDIADAIIAAEL